MPPRRTPLQHVLLGLALAWMPARASALPVQLAGDADGPGELSLEDLMQVEVETVTVGRKPQAVADTPAAVHVLSADDIRRSGATRLPEVLRLIPGLQVASMKSYSWGISARGFTGEYANKMLVLVDGRSVYTPLYSGTYWDALDLPLDTIERIEVVLGPGAALWGANAVNGVISIVTKPAADSQGTQVSGLVGTLDQGIGYVRQGGSLGADAAYRVWARYSQRDESVAVADDGGAGDGWNSGQAGFRVDWSGSPRDLFTVQGEFGSLAEDFRTQAFVPLPPYTTTIEDTRTQQTGYLRGRWTRQLGQESSLDLQLSVDGVDHDVPGYWGEDRTTFDFDFQHRFPIGERNDVLWGFGARSTESDISEQSFSISVKDDHRVDQNFGAFVQDDIALVEDRWHLIVGAKVEHNDYTGFEFQPNVRTLWNIDSAQTAWASVARAVRSPNQIETDGIIPSLIIPGAPPTFVTFYGTEDLDSEQLLAYEAGYRKEFGPRLALDVSAFFNVYDDLRTLEPGTPFMQSGVVILPIVPTNLGAANTYGGEVSLDWRIGSRTRVRPSYSLIEIDYQLDPASGDPNIAGETEGQTPQQTAKLWVTHDLSESWDLDGVLFYVDDLPAANVPSYLRLDLRAEWRPSADLRLVLGAQGLFHDQEPEFGDSLLSEAYRVQQAFYLQLVWSR